MIYPIVRLLERYLRFPRPIAVLTGILFLFGVVGGLVTILVKIIIDGILYLSDYIPSQIEQISINVQNYFNEYILPVWDQGIGLLDNMEEGQRQALQEGIQIVGSNVASVLGNLGQGIANGVSAFIGALPITFTVIVFSILAIYFISKDIKKYQAIYKDKLPAAFREKTKNVYIDLKVKVFGFIRSQLILMLLTAIVSVIGLLILQIDQAVTIAVILGLLDLIPYFGPGLILIPWSVYSFFTGDIFMGIGLLILYASTVTVRQFAEPKVLSSSMKLNPLAILVSLFAGLQLFGVIGLVIGPITLVLLISLYDAKVFDGLWQFVNGESAGDKKGAS
jgi:sporulation integral membrane protein YtvI